MSSLALSAAPFSSMNEDNNISSISGISNMSKNHIDRVRRRTIKNNGSDGKVNDMMSYIHKNLSDGSNEKELDNFNPPEPPTSIGAEKRKETDPNLPENKALRDGEMAQSNMSELVSEEVIEKDVYTETSHSHHANKVNVNNQDVNNVQENTQPANSEPPEYYKKIAPLYDQLNNHKGVPQYTNKSELTQKLNYMINLLEEQQDERTGHVFEELILYSFLGIFIIFVVDSFARAGKYVR